MDENLTPTEPVIPEALTTPELPLKPKRKISPIIPLLFGAFLVVIASSVLAGLYYFAKLRSEIISNNSNSPSSTPVTTPTSAPSVTPQPTSTPSVSSPPPSTPTPRPSVRPTSSPKPTATPTPSPSPSPLASQPTLDIRFGNPAAHVKQTYDEGSGDGRVINREYSSIQVGEFDEVPSLWSPKVTTCFHIVSNAEIDGSKLSYSIILDDKTINEGTLAQYPKMEAGKLYDVCSDVTVNLSLHKVQLSLNSSKSLAEYSYSNNLARLDYRNLADNIPPNFTLIGPNNEGSDGTCLFPQHISDNVALINDLKIEQKIDTADFTPFTSSRYCFKGDSGTAHTYAIRITDPRGNKNEQVTSFKLY